MAHCNICELNLNSVGQLAQHKTGKTHLKNLAIRNGDIPTPGLGTSKPATKLVIGNPRQHIMFVKAGLMNEEEAIQAKETLKRTSTEPLGFDINPERDAPQFEKPVYGERMNPNYCDYCKKHLNSPSQSSQHYMSDKHKKRVNMVEMFPGATDTACAEEAICTLQATDTGNVSMSATGYKGTSLYASFVCPAPPMPPAACLINIQPVPAPQGFQPSPVAGSNEGLLYCSFCNMRVNSMSQISAHRAGAKHKKNVAKFHN